VKITVAAPTDLELQAILSTVKRHGAEALVCGIGPAMTAHVLTRHLAAKRTDTLLLCGLGGIYQNEPACEPLVFLAEREIFADLGRCGQGTFAPIEIPGTDIVTSFSMSERWPHAIAREILRSADFETAAMATVSCSSADIKRAMQIQDRFEVKMENMEGAAAALVAEAFKIPLFELRSASNTAGIVDKSMWCINEALALLRAEVDRFLGLLYR